MGVPYRRTEAWSLLCALRKRPFPARGIARLRSLEFDRRGEHGLSRGEENEPQIYEQGTPIVEGKTDLGLASKEPRRTGNLGGPDP